MYNFFSSKKPILVVIFIAEACTDTSDKTLIPPILPIIIMTLI